MVMGRAADVGGLMGVWGKLRVVKLLKLAGGSGWMVMAVLPHFLLKAVTNL